MKFIRPKPISKTNKLIPKSYVVVKSSFAHLVPFSNVRTLSVAKFKLSLRTMWLCGQETARNWRALSGKRKFLCSKAKLRDCEDYRKQRSNKAYGRSEYTMLLCASCILFIVRATNYCIVSPMTHFLVSQWSLGIWICNPFTGNNGKVAERRHDWTLIRTFPRAN